jgi:hypothetical protein
VYEVWIGGSVLLVESEHPKRAVLAVVRELKRCARASVATSKRTMELADMGTPYVKLGKPLPMMDLFPGAKREGDLPGFQAAQRLPATGPERALP